MNTITVTPLSLEAGAAHLEKLLRENNSSLPGTLRDKLAAAQGPDTLAALFPGESLHEEWKYTPLSILRTPWQLGQAVLSEEPPLPSLPGVSPHPIRPEAVESSPALESLPAPTTPWERLILSGATRYAAATLPKDGFYTLAVSQPTPQQAAPTFYALHVPSGVQAEVLLNTPTHPEALLLLQLHIALEAGARLTFYHAAPEGVQGSVLFLFSTAIQREAHVSFYSFPGRYRWIRTESRVLLTGPGAEGLLYGAHTPHENELCDTAIRISHLAPHTHSNQLFRSIAFKGGRRVFLGRIHVAREGQKTNAYQSHKAILWENGAEVYSRPQLEIFADDVRCTHGVTTGFLQGEMLFYLRSRGIPDAAARALIAEGFLMEALESVPTEALRTYARHNLGLPL
jgi:hypothetical protein